MESTASQGMKVRQFSMPSSVSLHTSMPSWPNLWRWKIPERASGSDTARLLESCGSAGMAGAARYLTTTKCPTQRVRDGLFGWLPASYLTHLLAATLLVHTKLPLPERFSLLLGASSS